VREPSLLGVALLVAFAPAEAAAIDRDACAVPYEEAQVLRKKRLYSEAMEQLEVCRTRCPTVLAADCTQWQAELKTLTPTVVFQVHDAAGAPVGPFRVFVDGTLLTESPAEGPIAVDPGDHVFRFELPSFGSVETRATLNDGEHRRIVDATARAETVTTPVAVPTVAPAHPGRTLPYALIGAGTAALALGGVLGLVGQLDKSHLESQCAPNCSETSLDTIRIEWVASGALAALGVASVVTGIVLWPSAKTPSATSAWWQPVMGPGTFGIRGAF
jgi:hypothetical protein